MWVQLNDHILPERLAVVSVFDRGFMYGDAVFETMRAYGGRILRLDDHLRRLATSAAALQMRLPRSSWQIDADIQRVLNRNSLDDAVVRVTVSRGRGQRGPGIAGADTPTCVVTVDSVPDNLVERQTHGMRLGLASVRRVSPEALPAGAKHANHLHSILALDEAVRTGADEALMLGADGRIAECATANVFLVRESCVRTPSLAAGILNGITRSLVLDLAESAGLETDESLFGMDALLDAEEIFVTSSVMGVCPVQSVDTRRYAVPGPVTQQLLGLYRHSVREETGGAH